MNLLFLAPNVQRSCGRSQHVLALMTGLVERGHTCVLGTNGGTLLPRFAAAGIRCEAMPIDPDAKTLGSAWRSARILRRVLRDAKMDLVHSHHRWPELIASLVARGMRLPTVSTCHNLRRGKVFLSYRSDRVIAVSEAVRALLVERFGVDRERVVLVPQAPRPISKPGREQMVQFADAHGIRGDDRVVAAVGRFHREKGFDILVKAAMLHKGAAPRIRWMLVGNGAERAALEREITAHGLEVTLVDAMDDMGVVYARADVLVVPSRDDAMPLVPLEASTFGLPVVASAVGGLPEIIRPDVTGKLVPPEEPELLLRAVLELLADRRRAAAYGSALRDLVEREYGLPEMVSRTEALYASVLHS